MVAVYPFAAMLLAACLGLAACSGKNGTPPPAPTAPPERPVPLAAACDFDGAADRAIAAIAQRDYDTLATLAHPQRGVRLSPYATVDTDTDRVMTAADLRAAAGNHRILRWGAHDGTGDPIDLTCPEYFDRFVYSHDFVNAPQIAVDQRLGKGNSIHNIPEAYPNGRFIEYHVPGIDPDYGGMDWGSLRLVFAPVDSCWKLVGIVHDQWTI